MHNPGAGVEDHSERELIKVIEAAGFECRYSSTKKNALKSIETDVDFLIVGGGDGTVRKITKALLNRRMVEKSFPIALLPLGTANNIAKTLGINGSAEEIIQHLPVAKIQSFDVGLLYNVPKSDFFLESFGYGIFPYLMLEMEKVNLDKLETPEEKIRQALEVLHTIVLSYEPRLCNLVIDEVDYSGKFLLAEVMNTKSIGPRLNLAPAADPGDGLLEVVLVPEAEKMKFARFVEERINGSTEGFDFRIIRGKSITISWIGTHVHVDDEIIKMKKANEVKIDIKKGLLEFMV